MKKKILIIEDDPLILEATVEFLKEEEFEVYTATNGIEGIQKAIEIIPDLIISDISMPVKNGYEVCKTLQSIPDTSTIPFIFLTAKIQKDDQRLGMQLGADDYLTKPFDYCELLKSIKLRLEKKERYFIQSNEKFDALIDNPVVGVYIYAGNKFIYSNSKLSEIIGYGKEDMKILSFEDLVYNESENENLEKIHKCINGVHGSVHVELTIAKKDQTPAVIELSGVLVKIEGKECLVGNIIEKNSEKVSQLKISENTSKSDLSEREMEVLGYICKGLSSAEIAEKLFVSPRTIDSHRLALLSKTETKNTADLVMYAVRNHLVEL
jgi:PAS domain S-box-containing protein